MDGIHHLAEESVMILRNVLASKHKPCCCYCCCMCCMHDQLIVANKEVQNLPSVLHPRCCIISARCLRQHFVVLKAMQHNENPLRRLHLKDEGDKDTALSPVIKLSCCKGLFSLSKLILPDAVRTTFT